MTASNSSSHSIRTTGTTSMTTTDDMQKAQSKHIRMPDDVIVDYTERQLLRKIDLHVYPILFVLYMMSFLDRINISNAKIQGMADDLDLSNNHYNLALFIYFIPYILLEVPSNAILRRFRPSKYLAGLMFFWGVINMCMGFVRTYAQLVVLRFLLGAAEAGVLPGIIYLTSMYYKRHELQTRMSFFFCSTLVGGAFGGLLAYGLSHMGGVAGYAGWRWIFIIEGLMTTLLAVLAVFLIVDWPENCRFLSPSEKELQTRRLAEDSIDEARMDKLNKHAWQQILLDWKIWLGSVVYMGFGTTGYAATFFMPTILFEFGWQAEEAQVRTIPVYIVSAAGTLLIAYLSDKIRHRYFFIMLGGFIATIGYCILLNQTGLSRGVKFTAVFLVSLGGCISTPMALAWLSNNVSGHWKHAFSSGIQVTLGNVAGIVGAGVFLQNESPLYVRGYGTSLGMLWLGGTAATAMFVGMLVENRRRDAGFREYRLHGRPEVVNNLGDNHPSFRFTL